MTKLQMALLVVPILCLSACGREKPLLIVGSSCMGRVSQVLSAAWHGSSEVQLGGTELGLTAVREGRADIAACSREITESDGDITAVTAAIDAIGVAVHPSNPVQGVTSEELRLIYSGEIKNWSQLGGEEEMIVVIGRETASGTRTAFERALGIEKAVHGQELGESGIIRTEVAACPNAIGYLSAMDADDSVRLLAVDEVWPTAEAVISGEYRLTRPFLFCCRSDNDDSSVLDFFAFCEGEGASLLKSLDYIVPKG